MADADLSTMSHTAADQSGYENGGVHTHMPPPPVPSLRIPPNNNPLPTAVSDPMSPDSAARRAAPEPNKRALYVGGLDTRVTEEVLKQIFETTGHVQNVKIIPDKNVSRMQAVTGVAKGCASHAVHSGSVTLAWRS